MDILTQKKMKNRSFEDILVINSIENILIQKRKNVFKLPKPNTEVILLVSGGLDSILTWGFLLKEYKLKVYPLFLNKGEKRATKEEQSIDFFSNYYFKKYPKLFIKPYKQTIFLPQKEIISALKTPFDNLSTYNVNIIKNFDPSTTSNIFLGSPGLVPLYALLFARYLELSTNTKIRTIFSSVMMGDGTVCPSQTLTSLRVINLAMCSFTGDYSYQFTSPTIEPYLHNFFEKKDLIKYGKIAGIPMKYTWSCYRGLKHQCGMCLACKARKFEFEKAGISDDTVYMKNYKIIVKNKLKKIIALFRKFLSV